MGGALLEGWLHLGLDPRHIAVLEPQPVPQISALGSRGLQINPGIGSLTNVEAIVIAVKPQIVAEALPPLASMIGAATVVVSIMAGRTIRSIASALNRPCALVRAMPNTPAAIGRGITVAVAQGADDAQRDLAHRLLSATGAVEWIEDEALMDAVTAVSGSGPAYVFLLAEPWRRPVSRRVFRRACREACARDCGRLGRTLASRDARRIGLRENVTSPGGTTAAALEVLMGKDGLAALMRTAVAAATRRSRELAG